MIIAIEAPVRHLIDKQDYIVFPFAQDPLLFDHMHQFIVG
jgi:hypothetical protein